jgi:hydrogenase nickel incorporation protein HypA/HybF
VSLSNWTMSEFQAVQAILQKAIQQAREQGASRIVNLSLVLGEASTYEEESIRSHWEGVSKGTSAEGAILRFRRVQAEVQCMACFTKYHPKDSKLVCPNCASVGAKILAGEEFFIEAVDLA